MHCRDNGLSVLTADLYPKAVTELLGLAGEKACAESNKHGQGHKPGHVPVKPLQDKEKGCLIYAYMC